MEPIGLQLRKQKQKEVVGSSSSTDKKVSLLSIDEQIALLQSSIKPNDNESQSEDSSDDSDSMMGDDDDSSYGSDTCQVVKDADGNIVRIISSIQEREKIQPLSKEYLPAARCNTSSNTAEEGGNKTGKTRKRSIRFVDEPTPEQVALSGMEKTVREMLSHYEPVSQDRKPFFCRVCSHQANSMEELEEHKQTEFHAVAVKVERNRSFCKHCEKQFTSPDQLKGHMEGKAHKEKVARLAARKRCNYQYTRN